MTDLDQVLAAEGAAWRATLGAPPDLIDAAAGVMPRVRREGRLRVGLAASIAAVAALALAALVLVLRGSDGADRPSQAPAAVRYHGDLIRYAGTLSFRNAVADSTDPRRLYVYVNKDDLASDSVCFSDSEVGVVTSASRGEVRVIVSGYAYKSSGECPAVLHGLSPVRVTLSRPLGDRTLVDGTDGETHAVLSPATVPQPYRFAVPCRMTGRLTWNEKTGVAVRSYESEHCSIVMTVGRPGTLGGLDAPPLSTRSLTSVSGHRATMVRLVDNRGTDTTLEWRTGPQRMIRLRIQVANWAHASIHEIVRIADSVR